MKERNRNAQSLIHVMERRFDRILKGWMTLAGSLALLLAPLGLSANNWLTDFQTAKDRARQENKLVLIDFTGSDWCGWCMRLKSEVFDQPEFISYAAQNLILLEIDFPRKKNMTGAQLSANQALAKQYHVEGYPTLVVLNPKGDEVGRTGYRPGGPKALIAALQQMGGRPASAPSAPPQTAATEKPAPVKSIFPWMNGNARAPKSADEELRLKSISGPPKRRVALINNETLAAGDDARVSVGDKTVRVYCLEIRDNSVLIRVDAEDKDRELKLGK